MPRTLQTGLCALEIHGSVASAFSADNKARSESLKESGKKAVEMGIAMIKSIIT